MASTGKQAQTFFKEENGYGHEKENSFDAIINLEHKDTEKQDLMLQSETVEKIIEKYEKEICSGDLGAMNSLLHILLEEPSTQEEQQNGYDGIVDLCEKVSQSGNTDAMTKLAGLLLKYPNLLGLVYMLYKDAKDLLDGSAAYSLAELWLKRKSISKASAEYNRGEALYLCGLAINFDYKHADVVYSKARLLINRCSSEQAQEQDFEDALKLLESIKLDHVDAMVYLADLSLENDYVKKAIDLYQKAIEQKHTGAMYKLAVWMLNNHTLSKEERLKAIRLLTRAEQLGSSEAMNYLAVQYEKRRDYQKALPLYEKAIFLGHLRAMNNILRILLDAPNTEEEKEKGLNKLLELCEKIMHCGNADVMNKMASLLAKRPNTQQEALMLYKKASDLDDADAMNNLANLLQKLPTNTKDEQIKNDTEALKWYERAIFLGHTDAMHNFFRISLVFPGTKKLQEMGVARVLELCEKVRIFASAETMNNLGELLEIHSSQFPNVADRFSEITLTLYKEAKELGDPVASRNWGRLEQQQRSARRQQSSAKDLPFFNNGNVGCKEESPADREALISSISFTAL